MPAHASAGAALASHCRPVRSHDDAAIVNFGAVSY
jgi:hypothetical protein